jgi:hypothetical protein
LSGETTTWHRNPRAHSRRCLAAQRGEVVQA